MKVYLDAEFQCHAQPGEGLREVEVPALDGKCRRFLEGYRYIPAGETWTREGREVLTEVSWIGEDGEVHTEEVLVREDGEVFTGEMLAPHEDYAILAAAQAQYEEELAEMQDMQTALNTLGVNVDG